MLRSAEDWLKQPQFSGIIVMNPTGWDKANFDASWAEQTNETEFTNRLCNSTVHWIDKAGQEIPKCL